MTNPQSTSPKWKNFETISLKSGMRQGCPPIPFLLNIVLGALARAFGQKRTFKGYD